MNLRRWSHGSALGFVALAACTGTEPPAENYAPPAADTPDTAVEASPGDASADAGNAPELGDFFADCDAPATGSSDFSRERLREAAVACTAYQLCGYRAAASALREATGAYVAAPGPDTRDDAQTAFRAAMALWSRLEVMQYGPLGSMLSSASEDMYQGQGLREQVYAWPLVASCRVDEQLVERDYVDEGVADQLVSAKGLFALEYTLHVPPDATTACPDGSDTQQAFSALSADERQARRLDYAAALATENARLAEQLVSAYDLEGSFARGFVDGSGYPSGQEALNVLAWALIYVEREVKDWKLGVPAGLTMTSPINEAESPRSGISARLIGQNLEGFSLLFEGCGEGHAGLGFDDWLQEAGHAELAREVLAARDRAVAAVAALPDALADATAEQLSSAHAAVRELTTLMKADLFGPGSPLNLALPATVEGDTD